MSASLIFCIRCKSKKVDTLLKQTRSKHLNLGADEPMTEFHECLDCGRKWKC